MSEEKLNKNNDVAIEELESLVKNLIEKFNKSEIILDEIEGWKGILQFILNDNYYFYIFNPPHQI